MAWEERFEIYESKGVWGVEEDLDEFFSPFLVSQVVRNG